MVKSTEEINMKPKRRIGVRHLQAALLFLAMVIAFGMKMNMSMAVVAMTDPKQENHFDWDSKTESVVLSSFFWGYFVLQMPGGELADRYGGKLLLSICMVVNSVACIVIPIGASYGGWKFVCACRVLQGIFQGFLLPSLHSLIRSWAPLEEKSRFSTFIYAGCHFGTALQLIASGYITYLWGWQGIFYTNSILGACWVVAYILFGSNTPEHCKMITSEEKLYIQSSLGHISDEKRQRTPWKSIWTSVPFMSLIIVHCAENWGFWTLAMEIPTYLSQVFGVNLKQNGMVSALPYLLDYLVSFPLGFASDYIIQKKWLSVTACRKLSNSIGQFGPALALIGMSFVPTGNVTLAVIVLTLAVTLNAGLFTGFMLVHLDMAPNFAGALMGVTSGFANIVSLIVPLVTGAIVKDQTSARDWQKIFYISAGVYAMGNLIFLIFGTSEKQKWNDNKEATGTENIAQKK